MQEGSAGGPCRVAGHKQIGRCTAADADMSSTCRSRRSTKSIPGILLPRSCLAQSVAAQRGRQRVRQQRVKRRKGGGGQCGAMQRLIGCSLWTHAANSNAIAAQQSNLQLESSPSLLPPLSPLSRGTRTRDAPSQWTPS